MKLSSVIIIFIIYTVPIRGQEAPEKIFNQLSALYEKINYVPTEPFEDYVRPESSDVKAYEDYALKHWKLLLSNVDRLPFRRGNSSVVTAGQISEVGERLPPMEYLDLLETLIDLVEKGKIPPQTLFLRISGTESKDQFINVNHEHARVQELLQRAIKACADHPDLEFLKSLTSGELADSYQASHSEDFFPETLPGVRLKRPFGTLFRKYERLTGEKAPSDPRFTEEMPRVVRRPGGGDSNKADEPAEETGKSNWIAATLLFFGGVGGFYWYRRRAKLRAV